MDFKVGDKVKLTNNGYYTTIGLGFPDRYKTNLLGFLGKTMRVLSVHPSWRIIRDGKVERAIQIQFPGTAYLWYVSSLDLRKVSPYPFIEEEYENTTNG